MCISYQHNTSKSSTRHKSEHNSQLCENVQKITQFTRLQDRPTDERREVQEVDITQITYFSRYLELI